LKEAFHFSANLQLDFLDHIISEIESNNQNQRYYFLLPYLLKVSCFRLCVERYGDKDEINRKFGGNSVCGFDTICITIIIKSLGTF